LRKKLAHTVKKDQGFSRPQPGYHQPAGNHSNYSGPGRDWLVTSQLGRGKSLTFFFKYTDKEANSHNILGSGSTVINYTIDPAYPCHCTRRYLSFTFNSVPRTSISTSIIDLQFISACALNPLSFCRNIDVEAEGGEGFP
jgi:hypothetical protein